uniref:F-box domain-containing protein n=1 Tax=Mycena chlorophos TaxID=658473 RepID=A0ABQ0LMZ5_MYCCL|nr:predicted protein [Mycena chlorophos]
MPPKTRKKAPTHDSTREWGAVERADARTRLAVLQAEIADRGDKKQLQKLRAERDKLKKKLGAYKYPVLTLPPEIVSEIFVHFVPPYPDRPPLLGDFSPFALTQICAKWRAIALSTTALWSVISVTLHRNDLLPAKLEHTKLCLERSKSHPLSIYLWSERDIPILDDFVSLFAAHSGRWEHVAFCMPFKYLDRVRNPLPLLKSVTILSMAFIHNHFDFGPTLIDINIPPVSNLHFRDDAPKLREMHLRFFAAGFVELFSFSQLTILTLTCVDLDQFAVVLRQSTSLVHCSAKLRLVDGQDARPDPNSLPPITLPHLETLMLRNYIGKVPAIQSSLGVLTLPALLRLRIGESNLMPAAAGSRVPTPLNAALFEDPIPTLRALLERSKCKLQSLCINDPADDAGHLASPPQVDVGGDGCAIQSGVPGHWRGRGGW